MATSAKTVEGIVEVLDARLDRKTKLSLLEALMEVRGNASFRDTLRLVYDACVRQEG